MPRKVKTGSTARATGNQQDASIPTDGNKGHPVESSGLMDDDGKQL